MPRPIRSPATILALLALSPVLVPSVVLRAGDAPTPLTRVHAHNDYEHKRPLLDALDQGFCSVEADIFLVDGQLLVGHTRRALKPERTLQALYLEPLKERVAKNGGRVYKNGPPVTLFIDLKTNGEKTYAALCPVLEEYRDMITSFSPAPKGKEQRAIDVVITGACPRKVIEAQEERLASIDGTAGDFDSAEPADLVPVISENWRSLFKWRGKGPLPDEDKAKLESLVKKAHDHGRRVRFWAAPDRLSAWQALFAANVDLINTDNLAGAAEYLRGVKP
jgi:glycerophosphoryl diester phosphodiesterase family protein